jgi:hypothetical protein
VWIGGNEWYVLLEACYQGRVDRPSVSHSLPPTPRYSQNYMRLVLPVMWLKYWPDMQRAKCMGKVYE